MSKIVYFYGTDGISDMAGERLYIVITAGELEDAIMYKVSWLKASRVGNLFFGREIIANNDKFCIFSS